MRLRRATEQDAATIRTWIRSPRALLQWAGPGFEWPLTDAILAAHLGSADRNRSFLIAYRDRVPVGYVELHRDRRAGIARIARVIVAPAARGTGVCRSMLSALVEVACRDPRIRELQLKVYEFNGPAIACYRNVGFTVADAIRGATQFRGESWTAVVMRCRCQRD